MSTDHNIQPGQVWRFVSHRFDTVTFRRVTGLDTVEVADRYQGVKELAVVHYVDDVMRDLSGYMPVTEWVATGELVEEAPAGTPIDPDAVFDRLARKDEERARDIQFRQL